MGWGVMYPDCPQPPPPRYCPVCGDECQTLFLRTHEIVGCENCIREEDAEEYYEERGVAEYGENE